MEHWQKQGDGKQNAALLAAALSKSPTRGRLPRELGGKDIPANAGDADSIPKSGRSPGEGSGSPLQYSCLENSMDGGAWRAPWGAQESDTTERLSTLVGWAWATCPSWNWRSDHPPRGNLVWVRRGGFSQGSQGKEWVGAGDRVPVYLPSPLTYTKTNPPDDQWQSFWNTLHSRDVAIWSHCSGI